METQKLNVEKNFKISVEIKDLVDLGWYFDDDIIDCSNTHHIEIYVDEDGATFWRCVNTQKYNNGINEGSDIEETGDDKQTIEDIKHLCAEGKFWK